MGGVEHRSGGVEHQSGGVGTLTPSYSFWEGSREGWAPHISR